VWNIGVSDNKTMSKIFWNTLKLSPVILSASLLLANRATATEATVVDVVPSNNLQLLDNKTTSKIKVESSTLQLAQKPVESIINQSSQNTQAPDSLAQVTPISQLSNEAPNALAQVTSVSQLSDVQPTDWAFQALQSLVERYGCIAGYPDGTYRGNRALTRYEFAAGVNACLDRVNELIATATADLVRREDLATLQRLQEEFSAELATLRGRVDSLEAQTAELEANQFSTTTKLNGEVIFALADAFGDQAAGGGDLEVNTILADRARLNFDTSFTGKDRLRTRLQARNITPFNTANTGTNMTRLGFDGNEGNDVIIDDFYYRFPIGSALLAQIDFANTEFNDNVYTFNPAFESSGRGAISRFGRFNPIYRQGDEGAGLTLTFNPEGVISASVGYLAPTAEDPAEGLGLFDGSYGAIGQVAFRPSDNFSLGLTYAHTYENQESGVDVFESTGSVLANQPFGNIATSANHYGVQASLRASNAFTISGWFGYSQMKAEAGPNEDADADAINYAVTLALQDFGGEGNQLGIIFGQPPKITDSDLVEDEDTSYHLEGLYRLQLNDNIAITPGVLVIFNPEHNNDNENIYVGTVRTTFTF
jgi:predicted PhzF superfamily epimerase YddE/YHI9